jgi:hypothetical protein
MLDESAEKFQGASGVACMAQRTQVIIARGEFVIGLKTSEPKGSLLFLKLTTTHTL